MKYAPFIDKRPSRYVPLNPISKALLFSFSNSSVTFIPAPTTPNPKGFPVLSQKFVSAALPVELNPPDLKP